MGYEKRLQSPITETKWAPEAIERYLKEKYGNVEPPKKKKVNYYVPQKGVNNGYTS